IRVDGVAAEGRLGSGLEREAEGDGEIRRAGAVVHHPESQGAGPTPQVAVEGVKLVLQNAVLRVEIVGGAKAPVVVHAVKKRAGDVIVALRKPIKSAAQIPVAESPTPAFIRREGELMKREIQFANVDVVAHLGVQREPRARLDREVGVKIAERLLQAERFV